MTSAPALSVNPQILEMVFQTAFLMDAGRSRELIGALSDHRLAIQNPEGMAQVETFHRFAEDRPALCEALTHSLSFLKRRVRDSYRDASRDIPDRRRTVSGHEMVGIPGGWYVRGHGRYGPPDGWVKVPPFFIGRDLVSRRLFSDLVGRRQDVGEPRLPDWDVLEDEPVVNVPLRHAERFAGALREESGENFRLPTREEWEIVARGPAICLNRLMEEEEGAFRPGDLFDFAKDRFQNYFLELGGEIYSDPREKSLRRLLKEGRELFAYRVFATNSGRQPALRELPGQAPSPSGKTQKILRVWPILSNQMVEMEVPLTVSPLGFMAQGEENVWGIRNLTQSLWQHLSDGQTSWTVGGSYLSKNPNYFWTTVTGSHGGAAERNGEMGLRLALSVR